MKSKHTPGPWTINLHGADEGCRTIQGNLPLNEDVAFTVGLANDMRDEANARLMAAAPVLLQELRLMVILCSCKRHESGEIDFAAPCPRCRDACSAIAKAEVE